MESIAAPKKLLSLTGWKVSVTKFLSSSSQRTVRSARNMCCTEDSTTTAWYLGHPRQGAEWSELFTGELQQTRGPMEQSF